MTQQLKIGISCFFQYSFFSNGLGTIAISLASAMEALGHKAVLVNTNGDVQWYDDCEGLKDKYERRHMAEWSSKGYEPLDIFIDIDGYILPDRRRQISKKVVVFIRKPTVLFECEHSVYPVAGPIRNLRNCDAVWTWEEFGQQDAHVLRTLSEHLVFRVPFTWSPDAVEAHTKGMPEWTDVIKQVPADIAKNLQWSCHIAETNQSTVSNATLPIVMMAYAKDHTKVPMHKYYIHNSVSIKEQQFFKDNVLEHSKREGLEEEFVGRQRISDWRTQPKSFVLAHTRFMTVRGSHLDCVWNGIPLVHNSPWLREFGCGLERTYYSDNSIKGATKAIQTMADDFEAGLGVFGAEGLKGRREALLRRLDPRVDGRFQAWDDAIKGAMNSHNFVPEVDMKPAVTRVLKKKLRIGFSDLWDSANHEYNFWTLLLENACKTLKVPLEVEGVRITDANLQEPIDILFFGPFGHVWSHVHERVPKVHITGENTRHKEGLGVYLNLGFEATDLSRGIYRFPLWIQYIDWFGADQNRLVNPKSMPLETMVRVDPGVLERKNKFCAFVVTNPSNQARNEAFHILNSYKPVDSAGRLYNNVGDVLFTGIPGGGGGELKKLDFLKDYKFCISYENSSTQGYVTEKILAAKAAGCVPIYWGALDVAQDFAEGGFINANDFKTPEDLIEAVRRIEEDPGRWKAMASVPAITLETEQRRLAEVAKLILKPVLSAEQVGQIPERLGGLVAEQTKEIFAEKPAEYLTKPMAGTSSNGKTLLVTYATEKFLQSLANWIAAAELQAKATPSISIRVYLGDDIETKMMNTVRSQFPKVDFRRLPTKTVTVEGFPDLWAAEHFAWKIWIYQELVRETELKGSLIWYSDSGSVIVRWPVEWLKKASESGLCMLEDKEQKNEQWCHEVFCQKLAVTDAEKSAQQIVGGIVAFVGGSQLAWFVFTEAWKWAQMREVIVGPKWAGICDGKPFGHRHDQSILSILRLRLGVPVYPLELVYCHESLRRTYKSGCALYVHRGAFKEHENFAPRIGEVHLINLARRKDRLVRFKENHEDWTKQVCLRPAYDGRRLELSPALTRFFAPNDFLWKKAVMGCALSHLSLWIELANEKPCVENYLVLEDDVKFQPGWLEFWREASKHIPEDYDVLYLGGVLPPNKTMYQRVVEPVNQFWGRIAMNQIFGQTEPTRYFHFCNYSYILSRRGAQKIMEEIQRRGGYYTSADHMICNRVQDMVHYVLTPPVAGCYQDDDPKYATSEFNNYSRVDGFDSDLWNNDERWSEEEVKRCLDTPSSQEINIGSMLAQCQNATMPMQEQSLKKNQRIYTVGTHTLPPGGQLEYQWLLELFGDALKTIEAVPIEHEPLSTTPLFVCANPHLEDYTRVFTMYEATGNDFMVLHISDEFTNDPIHFYTYKCCKKVIRMYPRASVSCPEKVITIPLGPYRRPTVDTVTERPLVWSFVGTGWMQREKLLEPLKTIEPHKAVFYTKWMDSQQMGAEEYAELCKQSLFMACPGGQNPETFRFWEALEFGCIPLYVRCNKDEPFFRFVSNKLPLVSFGSWDQACGFVKSLLENRDALVQYRTTMLEKWAAWKAELRTEMQSLIS